MDVLPVTSVFDPVVSETEKDGTLIVESVSPGFFHNVLVESSYSWERRTSVHVWFLLGNTRMNHPRPFDASLGAALLAFNEDSSLYCQGISELIAQEYAVAFARRLLAEAKGLEATRPAIPPDLSEPNRKLIETRLRRMFRKHFSTNSDSLGKGIFG